MTDQVLIGLAGLMLSVLTYFAGQWRAEMRHARDNRGERIQRVVDAYMGLRRSRPPETKGPDGLHRAGIATLKSNAEVQEVIDFIVAQGEDHPLGEEHEADFRGVDLLKLFKYAVDHRTNFLRVQMQDLIRDSGARR
jgi:hypothetical protein